MSNYTPVPIQIESTFTPTTDNTALAATGFTAMDKIQFVDGAPETIPGWQSIEFNSSNTITGLCRMLYSQIIGNYSYLLIGTHTRLFSNVGSTLVNITPLVTSSTALANDPITTYYETLGSNPITTVSGSTTLTIAQASHRYVVGDIVTMSGAATTNGVPDTEINTIQIVRSAVAGVSFTIIVSTAATSSGTGGGASVVVASGLITVADTAHGFANGDRVKLGGAATTNGITNTIINTEHIIRNKATNSYDIMTSGTATSAGAGGGASVVRYEQIAAGAADASSGVGYSAGDYSDGLYSSALTVSSTNIQPRIWSAGAYGSTIITTPGGQTGVYEWDGVDTTAPTLVTNAPTAVNYVFIDREFIITLGASGVINRVKTSDRGQKTVWTGTAQNEAFEDDIEGAGKFISHASINGINVLFTKNQLYTMVYRGKPAIWEIKLQHPVGLIAQNARVVVNNVVYFMSENNLYSYDGSVLRPLLTKKWRKYIYKNINTVQKSKCFLAYRENNNQLIIRWPSASSDEPDTYIHYNIYDGSAAAGTLNRTAEEAPYPILDFPRSVNDGGTLYLHEFGVNDDGAAMNWTLTTKWLPSEKNMIAVHGLIPDSIQTGNITVETIVKSYAQSTEERTTSALTVTPTTEELFFPETIKRGGVRKYKISGNTLNGSWRGGVWSELLALSTPRV